MDRHYYLWNNWSYRGTIYIFSSNFNRWSGGNDGYTFSNAGNGSNLGFSVQKKISYPRRSFTGGDPKTILVPLGCVAWSLASGAVFAFSAIFPKHLFKMKIDPAFMTSMGMFLGGLMTFPLIDDWNWLPFLTEGNLFNVAWIIIFGTVIAFISFNVGLKFLTPEAAAITAMTEPVSSVIISYFVFGATFGLIESFGIILVLTAILTPVIFAKNFT